MSFTGMDRVRTSTPLPSGRGIALASGFGLALLGALAATRPAEAGSIFMKNGYIIQGPIVEYTEGSQGSVVLGWPNGKVTIYRRFIERVDFEAGEEKNLKAPEVQAPEIPEEVIASPGVEEELPSTLNELVKAYDLPVALIGGAPDSSKAPSHPGAGPDGPTVLPDSGTTQPPSGISETGVAVVPKPPEGGDAGAKPSPDELLGSRTTEARWGFSIQPPNGWRIGEVEGCVSWAGPKGGDGFSPSINVTSIPRGALKWDEACRALREDQAIPLQGYQFVAEESFELKGQRAYKIEGRGGIAGWPSGEKQVVVRQVLVEKGDRIWLLSTFSGSEALVQLAEVLEKTVQSFQVDG